MKTVNIIMATCNGEKYLREQMESLLGQTYPVRIYVKDDASTDSTMQILQEYDGYSQGGTEVHVFGNTEKLGYPMCFWRPLLDCPRADYYAFCDQDDVWISDKIERAVKCLEGKREDIPILHYSAVNYCDGELNVVRKSQFAVNYRGNDPKADPYKLIYSGEALGMTFLFNNAMREIIRTAVEKDHAIYKDEFIKKAAAVMGEVYYNTDPEVNYRRHSSTVMGDANPTSLLKRYLILMRAYFKDKSNLQEDYYTFQYFYDNYHDQIHDKEMLKLVWAFRDGGKWIRCFFRRRYRFLLVDEIGIRVFIALGRR